MILGAFVGLGFQVFENVQYIVGGIETNFNQNPAQVAFKVFFLRSVTGLWSHAVYTAIAGAGLRYFIGAKEPATFGKRLGVAIGMLLVAMVVHSMLDAVAAVPGFFVLSPIFTIAAVVITWRVVNRGERRWIATLLHDEVALGSRRPSSTSWPVTTRPPSATSAGIKKSQGKAAAKQAEHILDATYDLGAAYAATPGRRDADIEHARSEIARLRGLTPA